ncbi:MAG: macro domain-containing protein [Nanoarchaeota archaeon]
MIDIVVRRGSLVNLRVDAIVNPANSTLSMGGGVAKVIRDVGGAQIEEDAILLGPVPVGDACVTSAGDLPAKHVIHAPTMEYPSKARVDDVHAAIVASLDCAEANVFTSLGMPGMGTGFGELDKGMVAKLMVDVVRAYQSTSIRTVVFCDIDPEMVWAWNACLDHFRADDPASSTLDS